MAESIIFLECTLSEATENYKNVISGGLLEKIQGEEIYKYKNVYIHSLSNKWVVIETEDGECYDPSIVVQIAGEKRCIYIYINEDLLEGELVVIESGKIVRKLLDYYSTPELNKNIGRIDYEKQKEINNWVDIGEYMDYLFDGAL